MTIQNGKVMMRRINPQKNLKLIEERGASFEEVVLNGELLEVRKNEKYKGQWLELYYYQNYVWVVVVGEEPDRYITMYRSRKLTREFGYGEKE